MPSAALTPEHPLQMQLAAAIHADRLEDARAALAAGASVQMRCVMPGVPEPMREVGQDYPLVIAVASASLEMITLLLDAGAPLTGPRREPILVFAASHGKAEHLEFLVRRGAAVDARDNHDRTALHMAAAYDRPEHAAELLRLGASPCVVENERGYQPLHEACEESSVEVVRALLQAGASPLATTKAGFTPAELLEENDAAAEIHDLLRSCVQQAALATAIPDGVRPAPPRM